MHAFRADKHARVLLELAIRRERHPERFEIVRSHCSIYARNNGVAAL